MALPELNGVFDNISQRVALSFARSLASLTFVLPEGFDPQRRAEMEASQQALHNFFGALYQALYRQPGDFGLPLSEDVFVREDQHQDAKDKQEINRRLQKARDIVMQGLDFLAEVGRQGRLEDERLVITAEVYAALVKKGRALQKFLAGLHTLGVSLEHIPGGWVLYSRQFPGMLLALQALAQIAPPPGRPMPPKPSGDEEEQPGAAAGGLPVEEINLRRFHFSRCDFRALRAGYSPDPLELYRVFNAADYAYVAELHNFFVQRGYKTIPQIFGVSAWVIKYQGRRQVKASPLFQVEYQERRQKPLCLMIKCASANRITPLLPRQSAALQADFRRRANRCNSPKCDWCKNHKGLGPSSFEYQGESLKVCWYVNPDVRELDEDAVAVIQEYAHMHEALI